MKVFIQIPCFNEEENIASTLKDIQKVLLRSKMMASIVVINDGSTDSTSKVLQSCKVDYILEIRNNSGLANAFSKGIEFCLNQGADVIVNIDADGQYPPAKIPILVEEITSGRADVVIGDRVTSKSPDFTITKKVFQKLGSWTASKLCNIEVRDAASGFRAYSRDAAAWIHITTRYTYTLESLVQLSQGNFHVTNLPTGRNHVDRPSRLFKSPIEYVIKNGFTLLRIWIQYRTLRFFSILGLLTFSSGFIFLSPFLISKLAGLENQHLQLVTFASMMFGISFILTSIGFIGDSIQANRLIAQKNLQLSKLL
jgi:glycosyltransferase involved in cell wall biosynthesis